IAKGRHLTAFGSLSYGDIPKFAKNRRRSGKKYDLTLVISSVVPKMTRKILNSFRPFHPKTYILGKNLPISLKHRYSRGKTLGIDRLLNAYGALKLYGKPALVIDFGTAVTF